MWFARSNDAWINLLLVAGGAFHIGFALLTLLSFAELWLPGGTKAGCCGGKGGGGGGCGCKTRSVPPETNP
jgi:hypothetical protein